ncbi:hypothetical protein DH2020_022164 [Rehmannia glutinosa]|uniref:Uncharacterized protein n=1 Tax=Rehmannia glutinosa TaxID=99300 RepID=A0ABR0WE33_REHGL
MKSLSGVGIGLSLVFGSLLLALIAELYYLLWWKKRIIIDNNTINNLENDTHIPPHKTADEFFYIFLFCCWKKKPTQELCLSSSATLVHEPQQSSSSNSSKDTWLKPIGEQTNMDNFPRFLFTITEETMEDLESEDGVLRNRKQSTSKSNLSDLIQILETPFLSPFNSPPYFTPPLTPSSLCDFESEKDLAFNNRVRSNSPPPKLKFLRDAEEKMIHRRKMLEEIENKNDNDEENYGPFITLIVAKNSQEEEGICGHNESNKLEKECFSSSSSKVLLPLVS